MSQSLSHGDLFHTSFGKRGFIRRSALKLLCLPRRSLQSSCGRKPKPPVILLRCAHISQISQSSSLEVLQIDGGRPLRGELQISGSKNAALALMAASILAQGPVMLTRVPSLADISSMCAVLRSVGASAELSGTDLCVDASQLSSVQPAAIAVRALRAGFLVLGPLLARAGEAEVALPGGCDIGSRPIDLHIEGLRAMGAETGRGALR
uniref:UDP-N-acetylglucosamine 1-carboxyvinyltransferase n=1 Tax=Tetraselmis sp. GSL018 TaxID=582737 RepID=A0A061QPF6_9CHLO|mmetsp:Transcript_39426/g.93474  ORF Transcript_39426/g.93474 Transcript_39426/m.93474 type:complete len:208 (-) Transcript_39426:1374-1997(-)